MNNSMQPGGFSDRRDNYARLASWLQQIMKQPPTTIKPTSTGENDILLELLLDSDYHLHFYQQLPDFIVACLIMTRKRHYDMLHYSITLLVVASAMPATWTSMMRCEQRPIHRGHDHNWGRVHVLWRLLHSVCLGISANH